MKHKSIVGKCFDLLMILGLPGGLIGALFGSLFEALSGTGIAFTNLHGVVGWEIGFFVGYCSSIIAEFHILWRQAKDEEI